MPSQEFQQYQAAMAAAAAENPMPEFGSVQEWRAHIDQLMSQRPLPDGVTATADDAAGVPCIWVAQEGSDGGSASGSDSDSDSPVICYFHGGGYRMGSATGWRPFGGYLALTCDARVLLVDYRLAPEHPFPAAVDDAVAAYRWLLDRTPSDKIVVAGDSAGGGLGPAMLLSARDQELPMPAGCVSLSPWADLTNTAASFTTNAATDAMFSKERADEAAASYLGSGDPQHPYASPVLGDLTGLPPLLIQTSGSEVLRDDGVNLAAAAEQAGVDARLNIVDGMPHVWQVAYPAFPEAVAALDEIAAFVAEVTARAS